MLLEHDEFPSYVQFWTRIGNDVFAQGSETKIDLKHPSMFWDNRNDQNIIVLPDRYMFS